MKRTIELMENAEKVINDALRIALREKDANQALELFVNYIGDRLGGDRIYICEGEVGEPVNNTFEWCAPGVTAEKENLQNVPFDAVKWWYDIFEEKSSLIIKDIEAIKETEPLTYDYLKPQNIQSLIVSPLLLENRIIGFYGVDNPPLEILGHISDIAEIVGHFITSLLEKKRLMERLERLSFEDFLSGVRNRHALNYEIETVPVQREVGVIYFDILGLKKVNDTQGHQAGDELIIRASDCLKRNFRKSEIYRLGGDEFLVLCTGMKEQQFSERKAKLEQDIKEHSIAISMGSLWKETVTDMDALIAEADKLMYEEKRAYYARVQQDGGK